ncbi:MULTISPECIES: NirD/YgiW/YdeI family stress tolerance protein [Stenotrophomonas]|uniref:Stress-induced protein YgiW n=2 Tax=Stenotrophomonas geniculata TaxID=86188 RepID=A0A0L8AAB8_9GAMM|nr:MULTISPECIES: NirD/YgiW/YdeI family stress tolerance protein [Stenotrophomonas]MBH1406258.1 NirD/YgiW/YdeI family stress tolerance protein [Stenotrophomonas maltophilia]HCL44401.1 stress-induced protein YgiW [Pseudomonas sp.]KOE99333.1 stress-induced protein YgiW [Stenotrophomonas geniculata N1]KRG50643.1 stress-induced protein YgiW [Stenotrophomonas geniculata ATCC 19374 = JCM 13324]MBH1854544.1 NirD/YgiW/YdeI family stress tolerance protein [Stenotrophomonas maltophilia]
MNRRLTLALIATTLSLLSAGAFAQYTGPGATHAVTTVAEARAQRDDQPVVLRGTLVARIGHERYRFKDATGEIDVEIDDKDLPSHQAVSATTVVELHGEVDTHRFKPTDIDVEYVAVVPAH